MFTELVGGLAGGFTFVSTGLGGVAVGVAISTALVPPMTTCGILLAQLPTAAAGAFLLFRANFHLWLLEIPPDLLESVEWAASRPSCIQEHKGAHN